ncbi:MAG: mechanosensitive ion channel, partial [Acidobacteriota bacterium]|nr:mechanosensitive ion channel [Acidobacteriota bacterium]
LGSVVSALILVIAGVMAVGQLKLDTDIIRIVTACVLASLALAFGLSFGLGTREITRNIIAGFYARKVFKMGVPIEIRGQRGNLTAITPTQTLLDKDGETIAISNSAFLEEVVRQ